MRTVILLRLLLTAALALLALLVLGPPARADVRGERGRDPAREPWQAPPPPEGEGREAPPRDLEGGEIPPFGPDGLPRGAVRPRPPEPDPERSREERAAEERRRRREEEAEEKARRDGRVALEAGVLWLPGIKLWKMREDDPETERDEDTLDAKIHQGEGGGVRLALMWEKPESRWGVGLLYMTSSHEELERDTGLDLHVGVVEVYTEATVPGSAPVQLTIGIGLGIGAYVYDFDEEGWDDEGGIAMEARLTLGLRFLEHVQLRASGGGLLLTDLNESRGQGLYGALELGVSF